MAGASQHRGTQGFTLLEVMLAIAIFAVIGLGSWQILDRVITSQQHVTLRSEQLHQLQKALWLISRDLRNMIDRPVRDENGQPEPALSSLIAGYALSFTRSGWSNPLNEPRSHLQRVAYALESNQNGGHNLVRYYSPVLDRSPTTELRQQVIIEEINHFDVQFIDSHGEQQFHWPIDKPPLFDKNSPAPRNGNQQIDALPAAVLLRIETPTFGEIERLFALRNIEEPSS